MKTPTAPGMWFRYWMPYVLQKIEHPKHRHVWLPLNRYYKPLGMGSSNWVEYGDHVDKAMCFKSDPRGFKEVWRICGPGIVALYDDYPNSRETYFNRLGKLMCKAHSLNEANKLSLPPRKFQGKRRPYERAAEIIDS